MLPLPPVDAEAVIRRYIMWYMVYGDEVINVIRIEKIEFNPQLAASQYDLYLPKSHFKIISPRLIF